MKQASLELENLQTWSHFNQARLLGASIEPHVIAENGIDKGAGLVSKSDYGPGEALVAVPLELVLSKQRVEDYAKSDQHLKELIEAAASLFQVGQDNTVDAFPR